MTTAHMVALLATGAGAGFVSGFLGLGGAFITTPVQYMIYTAMGLSVDTAVRLAFGTSLLVVLRQRRLAAPQTGGCMVAGGCRNGRSGHGVQLRRRLYSRASAR